MRVCVGWRYANRISSIGLFTTSNRTKPHLVVPSTAFLSAPQWHVIYPQQHFTVQPPCLFVAVGLRFSYPEVALFACGAVVVVLVCGGAEVVVFMGGDAQGHRSPHPHRVLEQSNFNVLVLSSMS